MPILVLLAAIAFALSPLLAPDFGGFDASQFPIPQENPPVQPAGYAFAIWGLIYGALILGAIYGLWQRRDDANWQAMRLPLILSLAVGATWLPIAVTSAVWATVLIWVMWGFAVWAVLESPHGQGRDAWLGRAPVALYAGWLTAASCVSLGLMAAGYGLMGDTLAAILALLIALGLAVGVARRRPDAFGYLAGVIWALIGVCVQNAQGGSMSVLILAAVGAAGLIALGGSNISRT
ncbi:V-type ATP synthase subunit I [Roseovarius aquimarinus]|uniref:Seryl-tRNA synthetase n=1 Tax=Roseovarius aquimarinus TaxID=1229156 RepID=A0ABW7I5F3_9RHOB